MKISIISAPVAAIVMMAAMSSCNVYKKFEMPTDTALTKEYVEARNTPADSSALGNMLWENVFTDPLLTDYINMALNNNTNLANAKLNVDIANAQLRGAKLAYFPSVALAPNGSGSSVDGSKMSWGYQLPAQVSWEVDIFGKLLNSKRGAQVALYRSEAYAQAARSQLIAGVANTYYALVALHAQRNLSVETAKLWAQSVEVMRELKEAARLNETAVVQSQANYFAILASITDIDLQIDKLNNTMSLLLNTLPQQWAVNSDLNLTVSPLMREQIPMVELAARPDVAAAEQGVAAAYYATASARAAFYPSLNITASGGFTNSLGQMIVNPGVWFVNLAGQLTAPLFSRGANIARLEAAKASQQQAMNNFEYTLLSASAEVSDAMTAYTKAAEKQQYLGQQVANLEKSVEYTQELLSIGTSTYLEVLTAQQGLLSAQISQITTNLAQAQAIINLYQALGGGR
ncbi:MAG: TolC family protein [Muribaculaceae bacterium]|nr:TolC family protein [Muribaculaceae bacterium]